MSFITQWEATFHRISDSGTYVYNLTQNVDLKGETYDNY